MQCGKGERRHAKHRDEWPNSNYKPSFKTKIMSEVIQPNEGGHDILKMMLGEKKKNCWWKHLETPILKFVQMLLWLELGGERQVMVIPI